MHAVVRAVKGWGFITGAASCPLGSPTTAEHECPCRFHGGAGGADLWPGLCGLLLLRTKKNGASEMGRYSWLLTPLFEGLLLASLDLKLVCAEHQPT